MPDYGPTKLNPASPPNVRPTPLQCSQLVLTLKGRHVGGIAGLFCFFLIDYWCDMSDGLTLSVRPLSLMTISALGLPSPLHKPRPVRMSEAHKQLPCCGRGWCIILESHNSLGQA